MKCPKCGIKNPEGQKFCGNCGAKLGNACPNCGADVDPNDRFCGSCGAVVSGSPAQIKKAEPQSQPQNFQNKPYGGTAVPQPEWEAPQSSGAQYTEQWSPEASAKRSSSSASLPMILVLVVLLIGLGVFAYLAFGTSLFNKSSGTTSPSISSLQITGPFVKPGIVTDNTSPLKDYTIYWETNQPTIGKVDYGTSENYTASSSWETAFTKSHSFALDDLTIGLRYNYRIENKDASGNSVRSSNNTFGAY